jgi:hypothetical protein
MLIDLIESSTEELVTRFSTAASAFRFTKNIMSLCIYDTNKRSDRRVIIRILADRDDPINTMIENLREEGNEQFNLIQHRKKPRETRITIMVAANSYSLTIEMNDSTAKTFDEAIGLDTYSSSESTFSSYLSIFGALWIQSESYERKDRVRYAEPNQSLSDLTI